MNMKFKLLAMASIFALAACGSDNGSNDAAFEAEKATNEAAENASKESSNLLDKAKDAASDAVEKAEDLSSAIAKIDAGSLESFKSSLSDMQKLLPAAQQSELTEALGALAKNAVSSGSESSGGLLDKAKSIADGKSVEDMVYEQFGKQMDGMSFEDILKLASKEAG
jgi:membrane-associated HD superfamily phosphohydrolase